MGTSSAQGSRAILFSTLSVVSIAIAGAADAPPLEKNLPKSFAGLPEKHSWLSDMGTVPSEYAPKLKEILQTWPKEVPFHAMTPDPKSSPYPVQIICYSTPGNPFYIGAAQRMIVDASLERAQAVVDNFTGYVGIFDGLESATALFADGNLLTTAWEENIPVPFVPNEHTQMIHLVATPKPGFRVYRYGLKSSNHLTKNDGVIVLERAGPNQTTYTEFDFYDADWGIAKSFGEKKAWSESIEALYQGDLALKLAAEHADWDAERVMKESKKLLKTAPIDAVIDGKQKLLGGK